MANLHKKRTPFTPELKKFAVTLQFYSAKAYSYVQKNSKICYRILEQLENGMK